MVAQAGWDKLCGMADNVKDPLDLDDEAGDAPEEGHSPEPEASKLPDIETGEDESVDLGPNDSEVQPCLEDLAADVAPSRGDESTDQPEMAGWLGEEVAASDLLTDEDALESEEESTAGDWIDLPDNDATSDLEWTALEDERQTLPAGRILVGRREFVSLPQLGLHDLVATFETGADVSTIEANVVSVQSGRVKLQVDGAQGLVSGTVSSDGVSVQLEVVLADGTRMVRFQVVEPRSEHRIVFGRDAMEGYLVVDVAMSFLHRRVGSANPGN